MDIQYMKKVTLYFSSQYFITMHFVCFC